jgi:hypothetical protein
MAEADKLLETYWKRFPGENNISKVLAGEGFHPEKQDHSPNKNHNDRR